MDASRFDRLARALAARFDRRAAAGLVVGGLAGLLAPAGDEASALRRCGTPALGRRKRCKGKNFPLCYKGRCYPLPVAGNVCYATGPTCRNGAICAASEPGIERCTCAGGLTACGIGPDRACVDLRSSRQHCGSCFSLCSVAMGQCCATGPLAPGECIDTQTDERHCGGCGRACPDGQPCLEGRCLNQCRAGQTLCGGACVETHTDSTNCGACGNRCAAGQACAGGACGPVCTGGLTRCGAGCADLQTDPVNCGVCGRACPVGAPCRGGACVDVGCASEGGDCDDLNLRCCAGLICQGIPSLPGGLGRCTRDEPTPGCQPYGALCRGSGECCNGVPCSGNFCRYP